MKTMIQVFVAAFFANVCALFLYESYQIFKSDQLSGGIEIAREMATTMSQNPDANIQDLMKGAAEKMIQQKSGNTLGTNKTQAPTPEQRALKNKLTKAENMCTFWSDHVDKEATSHNKSMKIRACLRYRQLKRKAGITEE